MDQDRQKKFLQDFGKNLKAIRLERKLSLRKLADLADIDYTNLSEIETGKTNPGLLTIAALAEALQVDLADLCKTVK